MALAGYSIHHYYSFYSTLFHIFVFTDIFLVEPARWLLGAPLDAEGPLRLSLRLWKLLQVEAEDAARFHSSLPGIFSHSECSHCYSPRESFSVRATPSVSSVLRNVQGVLHILEKSLKMQNASYRVSSVSCAPSIPGRILLRILVNVSAILASSQPRILARRPPAPLALDLLPEKAEKHCEGSRFHSPLRAQRFAATTELIHCWGPCRVHPLKIPDSSRLRHNVAAAFTTDHLAIETSRLISSLLVSECRG